MKFSIKKIKSYELFFFISYTIYLIYLILHISFFAKYIDSIGALVRLFCSLLILLNEFINKSTKKSLLSFFIISMFALMMFSTGFQWTVVTLLFIYGARVIPFQKIAKVTLLVSSFMLGFIMISSFVGIIPNYIFHQSRQDRQGIGFLYVLYGPAILFNITALAVYRHKSYIKWSSLFILFLSNLIMYLLTHSRLSFALSLVLIFVAIVLKLKPNVFRGKTLLCRIIVMTYVLCFIASIVLTLSYSSSIPWMKSLNTFLASRLYQGQVALARYSVGLLGQSIHYVGNGLDIFGREPTGTYFYVDNFYIYGLQIYGLIFMLFYIILNTAIMYRCMKIHDWHLFIILAVFALRGLIDNLTFDLQYNTFWLLIGTMLLSSIRSSQTKKVNVTTRLSS